MWPPHWRPAAHCLVCLVALFALAYETYAVANHDNPWPLTFFVRCLNEGRETHETSAMTLTVTTAVAFLIGSWFWPDRRRMLDALVEAKTWTAADTYFGIGIVAAVQCLSCWGQYS